MALTPDERTEVRNAILVAITVTVWALVFGLWLCAPAKADCLVHVSAPAWCAPCRQMQPEVAAAKASGVDIREIDYDKDKAWAAHCRVVPTTFYVIETPAGNFIRNRIEGFATAAQLRRFCFIPTTAAVGAATRNAIRSLINPFVIYYPYPVQP